MFCNPDAGKEFGLKWELLFNTNKQYSQFHDIEAVNIRSESKYT